MKQYLIVLLLCCTIAHAQIENCTALLELMNYPQQCMTNRAINVFTAIGNTTDELDALCIDMCLDPLPMPTCDPIRTICATNDATGDYCLEVYFNSIDNLGDCFPYFDGTSSICPMGCDTALQTYVANMGSCITTYIQNDVPFNSVNSTVFDDCNVDISATMPMMTSIVTFTTPIPTPTVTPTVTPTATPTTPTATPTDSGAIVGVSMFVMVLLAALTTAMTGGLN